MKNKIIYTLGIIVFIFITFVLYNTYDRATSPQYKKEEDKELKNMESKNLNLKTEKIILAGGCFWCTEAEFNHSTGVVSAISGYVDSSKENPRYDQISNGEVRAREGVEVVYDVNITSVKDILEKYFTHIDPTDAEGQFADRGYQYTPAIYYTNEEQKLEAEKLIQKINDSKKFENSVSVEVLPFNNFYYAEEYHQDYKDKNPIRYAGYREGSGRNSFVRLHWQDGSTTTKSIFENDSKEIKKQDTKTWLDFSEKDKQDKLKTLTALQYKVTQEEGTEHAFSPDNYNDNKEAGIYVDIVSGEPLFLSKDKYDSGTGWPSFVKPIENSIKTKIDKSIFSTRTEVRSVIADSHLGHVFNDGPIDRGGMQYCMNGAAMEFIPTNKMSERGYSDYIDLLK